MKEVCLRALVFISRAEIVYNDDGSVTIDVRRALDDHMKTGVKVEFAASGRVNTRWFLNATMKDMSWLRGHRGKPYERCLFCANSELYWRYLILNEGSAWGDEVFTQTRHGYSIDIQEPNSGPFASSSFITSLHSCIVLFNPSPNRVLREGSYSPSLATQSR